MLLLLCCVFVIVVVLTAADDALYCIIHTVTNHGTDCTVCTGRVGSGSGHNRHALTMAAGQVQSALSKLRSSTMFNVCMTVHSIIKKLNQRFKYWCRSKECFFDKLFYKNKNSSLAMFSICLQNIARTLCQHRLYNCRFLFHFVLLAFSSKALQS